MTTCLPWLQAALRRHQGVLKITSQVSLTHLLTPRSTVLLEKLTGLKLVQEFPAFYGTRKSITAFTSARQLSLSRSSSIQSIPPHPTSWRSILILFSHLRLGQPNGLFPSGFPTKTLYTTIPSPTRLISRAILILLDFITLVIVGEEYRSWSSSLCSLLLYLCWLVYICVVYSVLFVVLCSLFLLLFIVLVTLFIVLVTVHLLP
jgi:hypothetical protein